MSNNQADLEFNIRYLNNEIKNINYQLEDDITYYDFFKKNNLLSDEYLNVFFKLSGKKTTEIRVAEYGVGAGSYIETLYCEKVIKLIKDDEGNFQLINKHNCNDDNWPPVDKTLNDTKFVLYKQVGQQVQNSYPIKISNIKTEKEIILGGKRISKGKGKKVSKKPIVSQKKQSIYKEILGKQMKIYKMPDSRMEYVKYKGELLHISEYKSLMKKKAKTKTKK